MGAQVPCRIHAEVPEEAVVWPDPAALVGCIPHPAQGTPDKPPPRRWSGQLSPTVKRAIGAQKAFDSSQAVLRNVHAQALSRLGFLRPPRRNHLRTNSTRAVCCNTTICYFTTLRSYPMNNEIRSPGGSGKTRLDNSGGSHIRLRVLNLATFRSVYPPYGFAIAPCNVARGNEKGRVESGMGYVSGQPIGSLAGTKITAEER